ncbi:MULTISPECIES: PTS galactosamine transporter subunit IIC [unclassified Jeotgalibaca]|uniref:PTS galactosamine transporter subunit IIC n=1 Tax=unclassified Jeotgalibaca TaxID=2621505 RepID=UPI003FD693C9
MEITLLGGILVALIALIGGLDFWLESFFIFRPIIMSTLTGLALGDLQTGLIVGGICELTFAGLTPAGGTQPPNPILSGVMAVVIAHTTGQSPTAAVALSLPFSFLMQYIVLFFYSTFSLFMPRADKAAAEADTDSYYRINILPMIIVSITYAVIVFLSAYVAQEPMKALVSSMPEWLTHAFEITGGVLPAIGFAMLLKVMLKGKYVPYLLIGFLIATFLDFGNILPVAIVGLAFALIAFYQGKENLEMKPHYSATQSTNGDEFEDGI